MKAGNVIRVMGMIVMLGWFTPSVNATTITGAATPVETPEQHVQRLERRLEEIKAMDVSKLSREEKKALRGEVKQIKKEMKAVSGGVYLSVGAIILIVLLIILLA